MLESVSQLPAARARPGTAIAYGASSTGGLAGQFPSRNLRQSSIVKRWIRSSSSTSFFSAASFRAPPFAYNDSHPLLHLSLSLLPSLLLASILFHRPVHSLLAFFSLGADRDSALRLFDVRSLPGGRPLQNGYAFTRLHRRKKGRHRDQGGESSHSAFPPRRGSSVLRERERGERERERSFFQPLMEQGEGRWVARKW